jgi:hypothetical protein
VVVWEAHDLSAGPHHFGLYGVALVKKQVHDIKVNIIGEVITKMVGGDDTQWSRWILRPVNLVDAVPCADNRCPPTGAVNSRDIYRVPAAFCTGTRRSSP